MKQPSHENSFSTDYSSYWENSPSQKSAQLAEQKTKHLTRFLRWVGALALLSSGAIFLYQGFADSDSVTRYLSFLGMTVGLAAAGAFVGLKMKEAKGARTFLALAAVSVTAHFAQLGAFIYRIYHQSAGEVPEIFQVDLLNFSQMSIVSLLGLSCMLPMAYLGFSSLLRKKAVPLTVSYLLVGSFLLLPFRDPITVSICILLQMITLIFVHRRYLDSEAHSSSMDGSIAKLILAAPLINLVGRAVFYEMNYFFYSGVFAALGISMVYMWKSNSKEHSLAKKWAIAPYSVSWLILILGLSHDYFRSIVGYSEVAMLVAVLPISIFFQLHALRFGEKGRIFRELGSIFAVIAVGVQLLMDASVPASIISLGFGILLSAQGYIFKERIALFTGIACIGMAIIGHIHIAFDIYTMFPWVSLGVTGMIVLIGSSYIEKNWPEIRAKLKRVQNKFKEYS